MRNGIAINNKKKTFKSTQNAFATTPGKLKRKPARFNRQLKANANIRNILNGIAINTFT